MGGVKQIQGAQSKRAKPKRKGREKNLLRHRKKNPTNPNFGLFASPNIAKLHIFAPYLRKIYLFLKIYAHLAS